MSTSINPEGKKLFSSSSQCSQRDCVLKHTHMHTRIQVFLCFIVHMVLNLTRLLVWLRFCFLKNLYVWTKWKSSPFGIFILFSLVVSIIIILYEFNEHDNLHNTLVKIMNYLLKSCKPLQSAGYQTDNCSDRSDGSVTYPSSLEIMTDRPIGQQTNRGT